MMQYDQNITVGDITVMVAMLGRMYTLGVRCGSCFHVIWNQEREAAGLDQTMSEDTSASVRVSVEALKRLIAQDKGL